MFIPIAYVCYSRECFEYYKKWLEESKWKVLKIELTESYFCFIWCFYFQLFIAICQNKKRNYWIYCNEKPTKKSLGCMLTLVKNNRENILQFAATFFSYILYKLFYDECYRRELLSNFCFLLTVWFFMVSLFFFTRAVHQKIYQTFSLYLHIFPSPNIQEKRYIIV